jgi:hypothetical protein
VALTTWDSWPASVSTPRCAATARNTRGSHRRSA